VAGWKAEITRCGMRASESIPTHWIYSPRRAEFDNEKKDNFLTLAELGQRPVGIRTPRGTFILPVFKFERIASALVQSSHFLHYLVHSKRYRPPKSMPLVVMLVVTRARRPGA
jgi:hypothetical protein